MADLLPENPASWLDQYPKDKPKIIHDNLWGTFQLHAHEVALLDTKLVQRLRRIHQTGIVYLTYPSAIHTRFEHSLGVVHQTEKLCDAIRRFDPDLETPGMRTNLRFAALLHDTGHGPFSHTSEQYFSRFPVFAALEKQYKLKDSGASEILSYCIIRSKPMRAFVDALKARYDIEELDLDEIARFVTGSVGVDDIYKSEVIHGPFDADKLDYMHRDSIFTGFRMNIDLDRLYFSTEIKSFDGSTRLAGKFAGIAPLTQIMFNKMQLFTSVYHHHKVRAADCMVWALLHEGFGGKLGNQELALPCDFLKLTDDMVCIPDLASSESARTLAKAIRDRRLWKRALVVGRRTVPKDLHESSKSDAPLARLMREAGNKPDKIAWRRDVANQIWTAAGSPCESWEVWFDVPKMPDLDEAEHLWITVSGHAEPVLLQECIPVTQWGNLYGTHRWTANVFCPDHCRKQIAYAAAEVLEEKLGLKFEDSAYMVA